MATAKANVGRQGAKNWTDDEMNAFFEAIEARYEVLFNEGKGSDYRNTVDSAWREVADECMGKGFDRFVGRTPSELRKDIFGKKKDAVMARYDKSQITGNGGHTWKPWEETIIRLFRQTGQADGFGVATSGMEIKMTATQRQILALKTENERENEITEIFSRSNRTILAPTQTPSIRSHKRKHREVSEDLSEKKIRLQCESLELANLDKALSIIEKADRLCVPINLRLLDGTTLCSKEGHVSTTNRKENDENVSPATWICDVCNSENLATDLYCAGCENIDEFLKFTQ